MWGSYICLLINVLCLVAQFYVALYPVGGPYLKAETFFELYLAGPFVLALYLFWKVYSWFKVPAHRPLYIAIKDIDIYTDMREEQRAISSVGVSDDQRRASISDWQNQTKRKPGVKGWASSVLGNLF